MTWERQEAGWYTSKLGGIVHERTGWFFWPRTRGKAVSYGAFKTMKKAMWFAEKGPR